MPTFDGFLATFRTQSRRSGGASAAANAGVPMERWGQHGSWNSLSAQRAYMQLLEENNKSPDLSWGFNLRLQRLWNRRQWPSTIHWKCKECRREHSAGTTNKIFYRQLKDHMGRLLLHFLLHDLLRVGAIYLPSSASCFISAHHLWLRA